MKYERRRIAKRVKKQEKRVAEDHGGRRIPFSGSGLEKGDGRVQGLYRIENKQTDKLSYSFKVDDWEKLQRAAYEQGEMPVFHLRLRNRRGSPVEVVILSYADYDALRHAHEDQGPS